MRFFSHYWASDPDEGTVTKTIADYDAFLLTFPDTIGRSIIDFTRRYDLRGSLLDKAEIVTNINSVKIMLIVGDVNSGYRYTSIMYLKAEVETSMSIVINAFDSRRARIRFDEFDMEPAVKTGGAEEKFVHRFLLWPREFGEFAVKFGSLSTSSKSIDNRGYMTFGETVEII
ncbi:MAG: hypothetical protein H0X27_05820 [Caulobacteraceae bacterium]|nr:hypothetical protein [Caulobacteraceae bacterium]